MDWDKTERKMLVTAFSKKKPGRIAAVSGIQQAERSPVSFSGKNTIII